MEDDIRTLEISVISDIHLGTHASKAKSLLKYLKSINPRILILNGDIIDSWRFSRNYFPKPHLKVIRQIIRMLEKGTRIVYVTGNHDEVFRKFNKTRIGNFEIVNQFEITLNNNRTWIFHGDIFDLIIHQAKWLAKLGARPMAF
jgi:UDP-2,3-diacylglucosamine pyrophosphatase LpxH